MEHKLLSIKHSLIPAKISVVFVKNYIRLLQLSHHSKIYNHEYDII